MMSEQWQTNTSNTKMTETIQVILIIATASSSTIDKHGTTSTYCHHDISYSYFGKLCGVKPKRPVGTWPPQRTTYPVQYILCQKDDAILLSVKQMCLHFSSFLLVQLVFSSCPSALINNNHTEEKFCAHPVPGELRFEFWYIIKY